MDGGGDYQYFAGIQLNSIFFENEPGDDIMPSSQYLTSHTCQLVGGIVNYDVVLSNGTITLQYSDWKADKFIEEL